MGLVNVGLQVSSSDALALLRADAYGEGLGLAGCAVLVLEREVPLELLALDQPSR